MALMTRASHVIQWSVQRVAKPTVVACPLTVSATPSGEPNSHGVTGGVYKAWERIHRGMLIRDY